MKMRKYLRKRPREDWSQRAKAVVDLATEDVVGRKVGLAAAALSPKRRTRVARAAAKARRGKQ